MSHQTTHLRRSDRLALLVAETYIEQTVPIQIFQYSNLLSKISPVGLNFICMVKEKTCDVIFTKLISNNDIGYDKILMSKIMHRDSVKYALPSCPVPCLFFLFTKQKDAP